MHCVRIRCYISLEISFTAIVLICIDRLKGTFLYPQGVKKNMNMSVPLVLESQQCKVVVERITIYNGEVRFHSCRVLNRASKIHQQISEI